MKRIGLFMIFLFFCFPVLSEAFQWREIGRAPLMPEVSDVISLQEEFSTHKNDIIEGIKRAEPDWNAEEVVNSLEAGILAGKVEEIGFPSGKKFQWMISKPKGRIAVERNVRWSGKGILEGFLITLVIQNDRKEEIVDFFIAKRCGNVTLLERRPLVELKPSEPIWREEREIIYYPSPQVVYIPPPPYPSPFPTVRIWTGWTGWWPYYIPSRHYYRHINPPTVHTR